MEFALSDGLKLPLLAILGLIFGSFVTALSYRLPRGESVANGRSLCGACGHTLAAADLVPVMSWLVQKGACRYCGMKVSWRYPVIEIMSAGLFTGAGFLVQDPLHLLILLAMTPVMIALAVIDLEHQRLPNGLVAVLAVLALGWRWAGDRDLLVALATASGALTCGFALDAGARLVSGKPGLGMGDTKVFALAGLALPVRPFLLFVMIAGLLGTLLGLVWLRGRRPASFIFPTGQFPFAPAILVSYWACLTIADRVLNTLLLSA